MKKTLFTGFAPNLTNKDVAIALSFIFNPFKWHAWLRGISQSEAEEMLMDYLGANYVHLYDSGRTALRAALRALGVREGDDVVVQAYTCVVVVNAIHHLGARPIYVDVTDDLTMDPADLSKKITDKTKAVIIQHTFGYPADIEEILAITREKHIPTIEDCAHAFGVTHGSRLLGSFADIGMYSFGSDKSLSCARGGAVSTNDPSLADKLSTFDKTLKVPSRVSLLQHLLHFPLFAIGKKTYNLGIGKAILSLARKLRLSNSIISTREYRGAEDVEYPSSLPNALAEILVHQLTEVDEANLHRADISSFYADKIKPQRVTHVHNNAHLPLLRYGLFVDEPQSVMKEAKKHGIILGDWYQSVIAPKHPESTHLCYQSGSCPNAERLAEKSINLPTNRHISLKDAERIASFVNNL